MIVARAMSLPQTDIHIIERPALEHQSNRLYDVYAGKHHLILKDYLKPDEWNDAPRREFGALQLLAPLDIAPRPVFYEPADAPHGPLVAYEYMPGEMWDRRKPTPAQLAQLAMVWLKMNDLPAPNLWDSRGLGSLLEAENRIRGRFQTYARWAEAEFPSAQRAAEMCLAVLESQHPFIIELDQAEPVLCFCRADPRFANVIQRPHGRLGLVDWEDCGLRDPACDLADIMTHPNQEDLLSPEEWQSFLQPYLSARTGLDSDLPQRMKLYQAIFPIYYASAIIGLCLARHQTKTLAGWTANTLPPNQRLRRYLARAQAWPNNDFSEQLASLQNLEFFSLCES